jgi:RNA polymerase sigma factor (sigma-70 family)
MEAQIATRQALNRLDERKRGIVLAWLTGYSAEEIAKQFGTSPGNIYTLLSRARQELRQTLSEIPTKATLHNDLNDGRK